MRLFLALELDASAQSAIVVSTAALRTQAPDLAWTAEHKLHLTLRFLGEQPGDAAQRIPPAMDDVASAHGAFPMRIRHVGAFPNFRRARVVWMGVEPEPRLELLHHDVELACDRLGFGVEGRPFRPHVTIARVRGNTDAGALRPLARLAKRVDLEREVMVERIDLMQSIPGRAGASYQRLHGAALRSA